MARRIAAKITTTFGGAQVAARFKRVLSVLEAPFRGSRASAAIKAARSVIRDEFSRGGYWNTSGGFVQWKRGHDFGDKKAQHPVLGGPGGRLGRAWLGGAGGFSRTVEANSGVEIGVTLPWAHVHRGGNRVVRVNRVTVVKPKKSGARGRSAMGWWLGRNLRAWISEATLRRGLRIPARPHALASPEMTKRVKTVLSAGIREALA